MMKIFRFAVIALFMINALAAICQPPPPPPPPPAPPVPFDFYDTVRITMFQNYPFDLNSSLTTGVYDDSSFIVLAPYSALPAGVGFSYTGKGAYTINSSNTGVFNIPWRLKNIRTQTFGGNSSLIILNVLSFDTSINHKPFCNNDFVVFDTTEGAAVVNVRANDGDPDGNRLTMPALIGSTLTQHGTFSVDDRGNVVFTDMDTATIDNIADSIQYTVCDTLGRSAQPLCDTAWLRVFRYYPLYYHRRPPAAADDHYYIRGEHSLLCYVLSNDADNDGNALGVEQILTPPTRGTLNIASTAVLYMPDLTYLGIDSFQYAVCDTLVLSYVETECDTAWCFINIQSQFYAGLDMTVCRDSSVTTTALGTGTWTALANNPAPTTFSNALNAHTQISGFSVRGLYYFVFSNSSASDTLSVFADSCVGYPNGIEQLAKITLILQPNPAHGQISLSADMPINEIEIFNALGQSMLWRAGSRDKTQNVDIAALSAGAYLLHVKTAIGSAYTKLIVER